MGKASGLLILAVSASLGVAYMMPWEVATHQPVAPQPDRLGSSDSLPVASDGWRAFTAAPPAERPATLPAEPEAASASWPAPVVVRLAPRANEPTARAQNATQINTTQISGDRGLLARDLQRELKRVGCYDGEINGVWTPSTRSAMKAFTGRVNAALPTEEPDHILLTLVQGHQDKACGTPCPAGQGIAGDGRCVPNAILAHARKALPSGAAQKASPPPAQPAPAIVTGWSTTTTPAATTLASPPVEGRMALAGPTTPAATDDQAQPGGVTAVPPGPLPPVPAAVAAPPRPAAPKKSAFGPEFLKQLDRMGTN
jgi:peptidoglycan hydrolase-like protein with peptidoglycan-binding domain